MISLFVIPGSSRDHPREGIADFSKSRRRLRVRNGIRLRVELEGKIGRRPLRRRQRISTTRTKERAAGKTGLQDSFAERSARLLQKFGHS